MKKKIKILVVDDEPMYVDMAKVILNQAGYKVIHCFDGLSVVKKAISAKPSLILLDINMPIMDGIKTLEALKLNDKTAKIPVVMCTARDDLDAIEKAFKLGTLEYVLKPYDIGNLLEKVKRALSKPA